MNYFLEKSGQYPFTKVNGIFTGKDLSVINLKAQRKYL